MFSRLAITLGLVAGGWIGAAAIDARADEAAVYARGGIAIAGYDAVAYFRHQRAEPGSMDFALMWRGATWLFVSEETMMAFEMDPKAYAPQYGGYCAYAAARGEVSPSDPEVFNIVDGKLYLNYSAERRDQWLADRAANITAADAHWAAVLSR
jgi:hypothetical protein